MFVSSVVVAPLFWIAYPHAAPALPTFARNWYVEPSVATERATPRIGFSKRKGANTGS